MKFEKRDQGREAIKHPKISLRFVRHSIKEMAPEKHDNDISVTPEGRKLAAEKFDEPLDMRFAHVVGSPRLRTRETASAAATKDESMTPEDLGVGKVRISEKLDFTTEASSEYVKALYNAFGEGRYLPFLIHNSDRIAKEYKDEKSSTYSRMAGNIASIIYRNLEAGKRGVEMFESNKHQISEANDFERILATHQGISESFLLKVAEKIGGEAVRDELLDQIGNAGFEYVEGFDVTISREQTDTIVHLKYEKGDYVFEENVSADILKEIITEGQS